MSLPPGPVLPRSEQLEWYMADPLGLLEHCAKEFGDMFTLDLGDFGNSAGIDFDGMWVCLASPELMKTMYKAPADTLHAGEANKVFFGGETATSGSIRLDDKAHMLRRKFLQPIFHGDHLKRYIDVMRQYAEEIAESWPRDGSSFPLLAEMQRITIYVIIHTVFGIADRSLRDELCAMLLKIENAKHSRDEALAVETRITNALYREIERFRNQADDGARDDIFAQLMRARDEDGGALSDREVHDELMTLLKAGFGTTANTLTWVFECLLNTPDCRRKLMEELDEVLGQEPIRRADLNKLPYLEAVLRETLRVRPLSAFNGVRLVKKPFPIGGRQIPSGVILVNCAYLLHRREDVYENPSRFMPERFLNQRPGVYAWTPFGGGIRMCIGKAFATQEMKVVVSTVLRKTKLALVNPEGGTERQGFFIAPKDGLPVRIERGSI